MLLKCHFMYVIKMNYQLSINLPIHARSGRMFVRLMGIHHGRDVVATEANAQTPMVYPNEI